MDSTDAIVSTHTLLFSTIDNVAIAVTCVYDVVVATAGAFNFFVSGHLAVVLLQIVYCKSVKFTEIVSSASH